MLASFILYGLKSIDLSYRLSLVIQNLVIFNHMGQKHASRHRLFPRKLLSRHCGLILHLN